MPRLTASEARAILDRCEIHRGTMDFHVLRSSQVDALRTEARARRYRKPRNGVASTAHHFFVYVRRALTQGA